MATADHGELNGAKRQAFIKGTRIAVHDILEYLAGGLTEDQILADFPDVTREDIRACLAFAAARERRLSNSVAASASIGAAASQSQRSRYSLAQLVAKITRWNRHDQSQCGPSVGREWW